MVIGFRLGVLFRVIENVSFFRSLLFLGSGVFFVFLEVRSDVSIYVLGLILVMGGVVLV